MAASSFRLLGWGWTAQSERGRDSTRTLHGEGIIDWADAARRRQGCQIRRRSVRAGLHLPSRGRRALRLAGRGGERGARGVPDPDRVIDAPRGEVLTVG